MDDGPADSLTPRPRSDDASDVPGGASPRHLLASYAPDKDVAAVQDALSSEGASVRIADPDDVRDELRAEMAAETQDGVAGPGLPIFTKEMLKGAIPGTIIGCLLGALVLAPVAIPSWGDLPFGERLIWAAVIGVFFGGTVGVLVGGALGARAANRRPAAERGTVLAVEPVTDRVIDLLRDADPIRIDLVHANGTFEALHTETEAHPGVFADRMKTAYHGHDRQDEL